MLASEWDPGPPQGPVRPRFDHRGSASAGVRRRPSPPKAGWTALSEPEEPGRRADHGDHDDERQPGRPPGHRDQRGAREGVAPPKSATQTPNEIEQAVLQVRVCSTSNIVPSARAFCAAYTTVSSRPSEQGTECLGPSILHRM